MYYWKHNKKTSVRTKNHKISPTIFFQNQHIRHNHKKLQNYNHPKTPFERAHLLDPPGAFYPASAAKSSNLCAGRQQQSRAVDPPTRQTAPWRFSRKQPPPRGYFGRVFRKVQPVCVRRLHVRAWAGGASCVIAGTHVRDRPSRRLVRDVRGARYVSCVCPAAAGRRNYFAGDGRPGRRFEFWIFGGSGRHLHRRLSAARLNFSCAEGICV